MSDVPIDPDAIEGIDFTILGAWMDDQGLPAGEIQDVVPLTGGTQNILLRFERGGRQFVLRRPPIHKRANSDETMRREARVLGALTGSQVPHPGLIAACADEALLGAAFYLMEPVDGFGVGQGLPETHASPEAKRRMGFSMVEGIAELAALDYRTVGLEGFGRPDGYLERQVSRWQHQLESYSELEGYPGPDIPGVGQVAIWLEAHRPPDSTAGILHGDYHIGNVMFRHDAPVLAAIVDWELATIGDPLLDLGALIAGWPDEEGRTPLGSATSVMAGMPSAAEIIEHYAARSHRSLEAIDWYVVLACYRLGIILEGSHARACAGRAPREVGDLLHAATLGLFERALHYL
jgi:aminoglycoside phosphotransferase (APT) family kinase protein